MKSSFGSRFSETEKDTRTNTQCLLKHSSLKCNVNNILTSDLPSLLLVEQLFKLNMCRWFRDAGYASFSSGSIYATSKSPEAGRQKHLRA
jgi:hypothetical protein